MFSGLDSTLMWTFIHVIPQFYEKMDCLFNVFFHYVLYFFASKKKDWLPTTDIL